jgi:hypothetical protein
MIDQRELEKLGTNISKDYVQKHIPLNDGLKKIATENGLNKQQVRRVAESANVATYLALMKTAEDKYLKFDLADANLAHEEIVKEGKENYPLNEYELDEASLEAVDIFNLYKNAEVSLNSEEELKKIVEHKDSIKNSDGDFNKKSAYLEGVVEYLDHSFVNTQGLFTTKVEDLQELIKQAVLEGTSFSDISSILKTAAEYTGEALVDLYRNRLADRMTHIDFDKQAEFPDSLLNPDARIYKFAGDIDADFLHALRVEEAYETYRTEYDNLRLKNDTPNMLKYAGFFNTASDTFKWFKEHPKSTAAIAMLASYKAGKAMAPKKKESKVALTREAVNLRLKQYKVR